MGVSDFVKVERDRPEGLEIYLVHRASPRFSVEFIPQRGEDGQVVGGVIKRVCLENSWSGEYHRYGKLIREAERYFRLSLEKGFHRTVRQTP